MPDFAGSMPLTHVQPDARDAATRYLTRNGYTDLLNVLGLDNQPATDDKANLPDQATKGGAQ